jgi:glutathione S-transferase
VTRIGLQLLSFKMSKLFLYHMPVVGRNPKKVEIALYELGLEYESIVVEREQVRQPEFRAVHPNNKVPVLLDGKIHIYESAVILLYLATHYDKNHLLYSSDLQEQLDIQSWMSIQTTTLS